MKKNKIRIFASVLALFMLVNATCVMANVYLPYDTYSFDYREDLVFTPAAYVPSGSVNLLDYGMKPLNVPQDMCIDQEDRIYIADSGNNRIIIMDGKYEKIIGIIDEFVFDGTFSYDEFDDDWIEYQNRKDSAEPTTPETPSSEEASSEENSSDEASSESTSTEEIETSTEETEEASTTDETEEASTLELSNLPKNNTGVLAATAQAQPASMENPEEDPSEGESEEVEPPVVGNPDSTTLNNPKGVCISDKGELYIADTENNRVLVFQPEYDGENLASITLIKQIRDPKSESFTTDFIFSPMKVIVDYADRIYVIASGKIEGIMVFDSNCNFLQYFGTINVTITAQEKFWRRFSTKTQRSKQNLFIATEFTGIDIDPEGFVYASYINTTGTQAIKRLNPKGEDVIKKGENSNLAGDLNAKNSSYILDCLYRGNGMYSMIDNARGRIFTYDNEGSLLYVFGGKGTQQGTFRSPTAIEEHNGKMLVLDADRKEIIIFEVTHYGKLINEAVALRFDGDETKAVEKWKEVLKYDENNELANVGIGKAYLSSGENTQAMKFLKLGMSKKYYSIAFKRYRNEVLKENLNYFMTGVVVIIIGMSAYKIVKKRKVKGVQLHE